jgi:putative transposase
MARRLRIEYPGAYYHVYSRGNQKQPIFFSDDDRLYFLKILREAHERLSANFHVYCLMPNHYHFALESPEGNLSQIMHFINTGYSIYLNLKHDRCGHLFQGRFKAILLDAESYARVLTMYIHGNPVRKGLVERPEEFKWSSAGAYFGIVASPPWLKTEMIIRCFGGDLRTLRTEHDRYLNSKVIWSSIPEFARAGRIGILGNDEFVEKIRKSHLKQALARTDGEVPEISRLRNKPEISTIQSNVISQLGITNRYVKKVTIFVAHRNTNYKLKEIGDFFNIGPIAVAVAFRKIRGEITANEPLRHAVAEIETRLFGEGSGYNGKL